MALDKESLKSGIKALLEDMRTRTEVSDEDFADSLSTLIEDYVKSATITVNGVVTNGSPATQTQTVPVTAEIS